MRRAVRSIAAACAVLICAGLALGAPPVKLEWNAPPGCSTRERVLSEISRLVATTTGEQVLARARVTPHANGFRVLIEIEGAAEGVRVLQARSCGSVARATALIVALAIDPQAALVASQAAEASENLQAESSSARPADQRADPPAPDEAPGRTQTHALLFAGALVERALGPRVAPGVELGGGIAWRFLRVDLAAGAVPSSTAILTGQPSVEGRFTFAFLTLRGCGGWTDKPVAVLGCAALRGSRVWARGEGAQPSFQETAHIASFEPGVVFRGPAGPGFAAELSAALVVPVSRPTFVIVQGDRQLQLFQPNPVGVRAGLALSYRF